MRIELISLAGILISLALLILMTYRGVSVLVIAPVCSVIVILSAGMPLMDTLMDGYMTSYADFVKNYFFIFFCSAILGKMMSDSGAARGIGVAIAGLAQRATGHEKLLALLAVVLINALLSLGGVGSYVIVFTMMTICKSLFEKLDMPWHMYTCSSFGSGVLTLGMMPGSPSAVNIIPTTYLGTTVRAAPVLGFIGSGITLLLGIAYFQYIIAKAEREHEGFLPTGRRIKEAYQEDDQSDPPPFWKSILPTAVLLVVMNVLGWPPVVSMAAAMADGGLTPEDVDYINAHGTSTPLNDAGETAAVKTVFGDHAYQLAISSTKSMTGHMLGAAGAVEALFCALALQEGFLPATIHYQVPDPACDLDVVPNQGRSADLRYALSNSLGFGGHNGSLLFKKWEA